MISIIHIEGKKFQCDLTKPIDISIPLKNTTEQVKCFYAPDFEISPVRANEFIGSIEEGGLVNFMNVKINPHGNGTHTECLSHIVESELTINQCLDRFFFTAGLITINTENTGEKGFAITKENIADKLDPKQTVEALIVRTKPNRKSKLTKNYSGKSPAFFHPEAIDFMLSRGIKHLLTDLPSVDPESDGGTLLAHKKFWGIPKNPRKNSTITELIYVDNTIKDGLYLLNIQIASFEMDASPSKPILYKLNELKCD